MSALGNPNLHLRKQAAIKKKKKIQSWSLLQLEQDLCLTPAGAQQTEWEQNMSHMMQRTLVNAWVLNPAADSKTEMQLYCMDNFKLLNVLTYSDLNITASREN